MCIRDSANAGIHVSGTLDNADGGLIQANAVDLTLSLIHI